MNGVEKELQTQELKEALGNIDAAVATINNLPIIRDLEVGYSVDIIEEMLSKLTGHDQENARQKLQEALTSKREKLVAEAVQRLVEIINDDADGASVENYLDDSFVTGLMTTAGLNEEEREEHRSTIQTAAQQRLAQIKRDVSNVL